MLLETFSHDLSGSWSVPSFPALDSERTLVLAFAAVEYRDQPGPFEELAAAYPRSVRVGCSTAGEILGGELRDRSLSVAVCRFDSTDVRAAHADVSGEHGSLEAGRRLARRLEGEDLRAVFLLSEGLHVNGTELIQGLNEVLRPGVTVTGGLAGDGQRFADTWVLRDDRPRGHVISAVGLYGDAVRVGHGSRGGWSIFGPERRVTRSRGNVLYELDGKPALELYKQYLGERAAELPAAAVRFPLAVRCERGDQKLLVRTVLSVDEAEQSMTFAGDIPSGHMAQLMRANLERLIGGAAAAARLTVDTAGATADGGATLAVAISCVGRRMILGERTEDEIEAALECLPAGVRQVGFYSYGEISPYATGPCDLHNQTMTLTTISEAA